MSDQSAYDFFRQETSNTDVIIRTEAMSNLILVCSLMTPEKVRADMIPYLQTKLSDQDQVLLVMAKRLGDIPQYIGGPEYGHLLLPIFEALFNIEETVVRTSATTSACKILSLLNDGQSTTAQSFLNLLKRLCADDHGEVFYGKVSACQIIDEVYRLCSNDRTTIQELYFNLCKDEMTIVKRSATLSFIKLIKYVDPSLQSTDYFELLKTLSSVDEHLTIRSIIVSYYLSYCMELSKSGIINNIINDIIPLIKSTADDNSWKIRLSIVKDFGQFVNCFSREAVLSELFPSFIHLIQDSESDVRSLACESAIYFIDIIGTDLFLSEIVPIIIQLVQDVTLSVRKSLADMCISIAIKINNIDLITQYLNDIIIKLLNDEDASVKLRILQKITLVSDNIPSLLQLLTPTIKILYADDNWRVRKEITLHIPAILKSLGIEFFTENFIQQYLEIFKDNVAEVRIANTTTLPILLKASNNNLVWFYDKIFNQLKSILNLSNNEYIYRITLLLSLKEIIINTYPILNDKIINEIILVIIQNSNDIVPNVRIICTIILGEIVKMLNNLNNSSSSSSSSSNTPTTVATSIPSSNIILQIKPVLSELSNDKDKDVKYFAQESLKIC